MSRRTRMLVWACVEVAAILGLHAVLLRIMADRQIASTILSAGGQVPRATALAAGAFFLVRTYAVLLLPGVILARLCAAWLADPSQAPRRESSGP